MFGWEYSTGIRRCACAHGIHVLGGILARSARLSWPAHVFHEQPALASRPFERRLDQAQNGGTLSRRARESEFAALAEAEVAAIERLFVEAHGDGQVNRPT